MCHKSNIGCLDSDEEIDVAPMELIGVYAFYLLMLSLRDCYELWRGKRLKTGISDPGDLIDFL
jgi:hypothetical protein